MNETSFYDRQARLRRIIRRLLVLTAIGSLGVAAMGAGAAAVILIALSHNRAPTPTLDELQIPMLLGGCLTLAITVLTVFVRLVTLHYSRGAILHMFHARELRSAQAPLSTQDQRLINVVDEMALASATAAPRVVLLDDDDSINAFALVQRDSDAIVGATAGALERLDRDELQALMAHEIGHIVNGDAAINIRLLALIQGFRGIYDFSVGLIGWPFRKLDRRGFSLFVGFYMVLFFGGLFVIGLFGAGVARVMQAAIARQREYLADASAVQFARATRGLVGALEKAAAYHLSKRRRPTQQAAFMMFVSPYRARSWLLRTHPKIDDRIEAARAMTPGIGYSEHAPGATPRA